MNMQKVATLNTNKNHQ